MMTFFRRFIPYSRVIAVLTVLLGAARAPAQSYAWAVATSGSWSNSGNWSPSGLSTGASVVLNFGGSTTYTATDDISGAFTLNQLSFNGSTAGTTITIDLSSSAGATGITLGGTSPGIILASTNQAAVTFTAATPLTLAAAATISNNSSNGALLTILSTVNNSGFTLLVNGTANTAINGAISGAGGLTMSGAGQLQLNGSNTYGGPTTINSGTILFNGSASLSPNTTVTVNSGATAGFAFVPSPSQLQQFAGASSGVIALSASLNGTFDFSPAGANLASISLGATGAFTFSGTLVPSGGVYLLGGGGGTLTVSSALTGAVNTLALAANGTAPTVVILTNSGNSFTGVSIGPGATLQISGADGAAGSASSLLGAVPSTAQGNTGANIIFNGGIFQLGATGTTLASTRSIYLGAGGGTINTNGFALTLSNAFSGSGSFTKSGTGTLTLNSSLGSIAGLTIMSPGTTTNTLNLGGQSVTVNGALTITGVVNGASALTELPSTLTNFTSLTVNGPVNIGVDSAATLTAGTATSPAVITFNAGTNNVIIGDKTNNGSVIAYATVFTASNASSFSISAANVQIGGGTTFTGNQSGTLTLPSNASATVTANIAVAQGGTFQVGGGNIDNTSAVTGRIVLGDATTTITAPYMDLGERETSGYVGYYNGTTYLPGGTLILSGPSGSAVNIDVGRNAQSNGAIGFNTTTNTFSAFDTSRGTIIGPASATSTSGYALIGTLRLGFYDAPNTGSGTGLFVVDGTNSRVFISSVVLAQVTTSANNPLNTRGIFTVNDGVVIIGSGGIVNNVGTAVGSSQVNVFGGTLNMQGYNIGALNGQTSPAGAGLNLTGGILLNAGSIATTGSNFNQSGGALVRNTIGTTAIAGPYNVTSSAPGFNFTVPSTAPVNYGNPAVGGATMVLDSVTAGGAVAVTAASLNRAGTGTLNIIPMGGSLGTNETVTFTTSPATIQTTTATNLVPVYVVAQTNGTSNTAGTYVTQTGNGLYPLTYSTLTDITLGTSSDIFDASGASTNTTLNSALNLLALRSSVVVNLNGNTLTIGSGASPAGVLLNGGSITGGGTLSFGGNEAVIYAGAGSPSIITTTITGTAGLTFFGGAATATVAAGMLQITTDNTATLTAGAVNINGGIFAADNSGGSATGSLAVNVNSGGTLAGNGSIAGAVTVGRFGTVAPGVGGSTATGALSIHGNTVFAREADLAIRLGASGNSDALQIVGSSTTLMFQYGAVVDLTALPGFNPLQNASYTIATTGGGAYKTMSMTGAASTIASGTVIATYAQATGPVLTDPVTISLASGFGSMPLGASFDLVTSGVNLELNYTAVPEPVHVLLLGCGALLTWLGIRRRFALACPESWSEPEA
jgi:fibronectin-binding autotransporter adhesin